MISKLTACTLIENWIQTEWDEKEHKCQTAEWDCQDTDCNNETECYFYYPSHLSEQTILEYGEELCEMLGVPEGCYEFEFNEELNEWRIEVIVSVSVRCNGHNYKLVQDADECI